MNNFDYHLLANFQDFFIRHRGVYIYLIIINLVTFAVFGIDKFNAIHHRSRIRVSTLFRLSLIGGSIGGLAAMYLFRHKTQKLNFTLGIPLILFVQIIILFLQQTPDGRSDLIASGKLFLYVIK